MIDAKVAKHPELSPCFFPGQPSTASGNISAASLAELADVAKDDKYTKSGNQGALSTQAAEIFPDDRLS
jgi:hypothetical protein